MEKKYDINRYYAHDYRGTAVMATSFETLAKFYDYAKEKDLQVCFCPQNHASVMVTNYKVVQPIATQTVPTKN